MIGAMRRLPPAFLLALVVQCVIVALRITMVSSGESLWMGSASWSLLAQGVSLVTVSLLAAGAFDLGRRTSSSAAGAARTAGVVFTVAVGLVAVGIVVDYLQMSRDGGPIELLYTVESYVWSATMIGGFAALITAAGGWRRAPVLAGVAIVAIVISRAPPVLWKPLHAVFLEVVGRAGATLVFSLLWLVALGATVALLAGMDKVEPSEDALACERGLRRASSALWLRVIAAGALVLVMLLAVASRGGGASMLKAIMVGAPVLNAFALASFALGAFTVARSGARDFSPFALYSAGALSLWSAGALLAQAPWLYRAYYHPGSDNDYGLEMAQALGMAIPVVAAAGVVVLTVAIAGFARRRSLYDLHEQTSLRAGAFVVLMIGSLLIGKYVLPKARSEGALIAMSLAIGAASLCAVVLVAKLCSLAAAAVAQAPGLPTATVHES